MLGMIMVGDISRAVMDLVVMQGWAIRDMVGGMDIMVGDMAMVMVEDTLLEAMVLVDMLDSGIRVMDMDMVVDMVMEVEGMGMEDQVEAMQSIDYNCF